MRLLLVEADTQLGVELVEALRAGCYTVDWARSPKAGVVACAAQAYAATVLAVASTPCEGMAAISRIRQLCPATALVGLAEDPDPTLRIQGLDQGADDFLVKPFQSRELLARLRAILRSSGGHCLSVISHGAIALDTVALCAMADGARVDLTQREFSLLHALMHRPGAVVSREVLEESLYGWDDGVESNVIDVTIHNIRRKLGSEVIRNVRGAGWTVTGGR